MGALRWVSGVDGTPVQLGQGTVGYPLRGAEVPAGWPMTANSELSRVEQIKRYRVLDQEWRPGGDELSATMKLKRRQINEKYRGLIDELYETG